MDCVCGGNITLRCGEGRTRRLTKSVTVRIPDNIKIPTCDSCGDEYYSAKTAEEIDHILWDILEREAEHANR